MKPHCETCKCKRSLCTHSVPTSMYREAGRCERLAVKGDTQCKAHINMELRKKTP